jgi:hypothetical protein
MSDTIQIGISRNAYARVQQLAVSPYTGINVVSDALLEYEGHPAPAVTTMKSDQQHLLLARGFEGAGAGVCEYGGPHRQPPDMSWL